LSHSVRTGIVLLTFVAAVVAAAEAQYGVPLNRNDEKLEPVTVRELVARYCRMDYAGARLNPADWPKLQPLVAWPANPDFSLMMVTLRFDVDAEPVPQRGKYLVTVHFRLLGKYDMAEGYSPRPASAVEDVQFVVAEVNGDWRITDAEPNYPHPSRSVLMQWLNKKLDETQDPAAKVIYRQAVEQLQAQAQKAPASTQ
jgi:hypothetical protein